MGRIQEGLNDEARRVPISFELEETTPFAKTYKAYLVLTPEVIQILRQALEAKP